MMRWPALSTRSKGIFCTPDIVVPGSLARSVAMSEPIWDRGTGRYSASAHLSRVGAGWIATLCVTAALLFSSAAAAIGAEAGPRAAVLFSTQGNVPDTALKKWGFKLNILLRAAGWRPASFNDTADEMPSPSDPWLSECFDKPECLDAMSKTLDVSALVLVVVTRDGEHYAVQAAAWSQGVGTDPFLLRAVAFRDLQEEGGEQVRLALASLDERLRRRREEPSPAAPHVHDGANPSPSLGANADLAPTATTVPSATSTPEPQPPPPVLDAPPAPTVTDSAMLDFPEMQPPCVDIFDPAAARSEPEAVGDAPVFVKPKVLLLPVVGVDKAHTRNTRVFAQTIEASLLAHLRLDRIDFVTYCPTGESLDANGRSAAHDRMTLEMVRERPLHGVEWVFEVALKVWNEEKKGDQYNVESELGLRMFEVTSGAPLLDTDAAVAVPTMLDYLTFMAEDAGERAKQQAMDAVAGAVGGGSSGASAIGETMDAVKVAAGEASRMDGAIGELAQQAKEHIGRSPEDEEYEYKIAQNLAMAGDKLALAVKKHRRFRLASPVVARNADEAGIAVGMTEGVRLNDTFVFSNGDPEVWDGFGRVTSLGLGGASGRVSPSFVEVISDYGNGAEAPQAIEYPLIGVQVGAVSAMVPLRHASANLLVGDAIAEVGIVAPAIAVDVRFRIPWLPITELYETNQVTFVMDDPLQIIGAEAGLEKRWLWGRWVPALGLRYSYMSVGMPIPDPENASKQQTAMASAHGVEGYSGMGLFLHPTLMAHVQIGYRQFFRRVNQFQYGDDTYFARDVDGDPWVLDFSGPIGKVMVSYEF